MEAAETEKLEIYRRAGFYCSRISEQEIAHQFQGHSKIHKVNAPIMEISSTFIRKNHAAGKNVKTMLPDAVWSYIDEMNFYK